MDRAKLNCIHICSICVRKYQPPHTVALSTTTQFNPTGFKTIHPNLNSYRGKINYSIYGIIDVFLLMTTTFNEIVFSSS